MHTDLIIAQNIPSWLVPFGIDLALAILVLEAIVLTIYRWWTGRGLDFRSIALIFLAGAGLLVALKAGVTGGSVLWVLLGLMTGGIAHALDLIRRLKVTTRVDRKTDP